MPRGEAPTTGRWRLGIMIALAGILAVAALLVLRSGEEPARPTLGAAEIASLPDVELMRRIRIDLTARSLAGTALPPPPAAMQPVLRSIAFEETRAGIGLARSLESGGGAGVLAAAYDELGARETAACLRRMSTAAPTSEADRGLQQALARAGLERLRAVWVRAHPEAFAATP